MPTVKAQVNRTLRHQIGDSVFHSSHARELGYSSHGKEVVKEHKGLINAIYKMSKEKIMRYEDPEKRFRIKLDIPEDGYNINRAYILETNNKKYYIKEQNDEKPRKPQLKFSEKYDMGFDAVSEHKAIELLKKEGLDVIPAHFSYVDPKAKKSFIAYDFTKLKTLERLHTYERKIGKVRYDNLAKRLIEIQKELNRKFHEFKLDRYHAIGDLTPDNVFYSLRENKFYIFDPWLKKNGGE